MIFLSFSEWECEARKMGYKVTNKMSYMSNKVYLANNQNDKLVGVFKFVSDNVGYGYFVTALSDN